MFDRFQMVKDVQDLTAKIDPRMFGMAIIVSLLCSLLASWMYGRFYERRGTGSQVHRAFPLLALSITSLFICIQVSLPLSLGLLGALSIIRFRTPIKEPEEVGFIMLVIASSIICATFNFQFLIFLYLTALITLILIRRARAARRTRGDGIVLVALRDAGSAESQKKIEECVRRFARRSSMESSTCRDGMVSMQFSFTGLQGHAADLQSAVKEAAEVSAVDIFFNRPGGLS